MKAAAISLSKLSFSQKLQLLENLWADLVRTEKKLKSPEWHEDVLNDREEALTNGKVEVSDWEQAKKRIRKNTA